jgi:HAD superfamily hydrolase (TIGR01549 family)
MAAVDEPKAVDCKAIIRIAARADNYVYRMFDQAKAKTIKEAVQLEEWQPYLHQLIKLTKLERAKALQWYFGWHDHWAEPGDQVQPFFNAVQVVKELADRGFRIGVLSNTEWDLQPIFLRDGFSPYIKAVITSGKVGFQKPELAIYQAACHSVNTTSSQCALVGDTLETDIKGAHQSGWLPVFIRRPKRKITKTFSGEILEVSSLSDLLAYFIAG